jgi:hypothetical protein
MSVLKPYIDSGKLVVRSKQMGMDKVGTLRWDGATAQARMDNLLSAFYTNARSVDAVLSPYDGLSIGILSSLKGVGYGTPKQPMPVVSGQDAEVPSVKSMLRGEQYLDRLQGHARARQGHGRHGRRDAQRQEPPRSTTPRPTTTASRSCRRTCSSRSASMSRTGSRS